VSARFVIAIVRTTPLTGSHSFSGGRRQNGREADCNDRGRKRVNLNDGQHESDVGQIKMMLALRERGGEEETTKQEIQK
jgi:hypothetical protein